MRLDSIIGTQPFLLLPLLQNVFSSAKIEIANQSAATIIVLIILLS